MWLEQVAGAALAAAVAAGSRVVAAAVSVRPTVSGVDYSLATLRANGRGEDMRIE